MNKDLFSIAFYNVENLFDYLDNHQTLDREFTPSGKKKWGPYRYNLKIQKLGMAISKIGKEETGDAPFLIGLAEVENKKVLTDLVDSNYLKQYPYDFVHYDSPDERGIDTALLYRKDCFEVLDSKAIPVLVFNGKVRDFTRDILYVKGKLNNEIVHVFVNHWPSKRLGSDYTKAKRMEVAGLLLNEMKQLNSNEKVVVLGDFNDNPTEPSMQKLIDEGNLHNPMKDLFQQGLGSSKFYSDWMLFDQILFSNDLKNNPSETMHFKSAHIYKDPYLMNPKGRFKNEPFRTYTRSFYQGGYSDHFPVYAIFKKKS